MLSKIGKTSWIAFILFYVILLLIITVLDSLNNVLTLPYWLTQAALTTVGLGILAVVGYRIPNLSASASIFLSFTVGVLTIIPAVLMGIGQIPNFWQQYFSVAGAMAAGSFFTFIFLALTRKHTTPPKPPTQTDEDLHEYEYHHS